MTKRKPCSNCPFLKDTVRGWLGEKRAAGIAQVATSDLTFSCHKSRGSELICAGSVLLHKNEGQYANRLYRLIQEDFDGADLVFASAQDFINHHTE